MLQVFNLKKFPFEFNNETFYCFSKDYIPYLLGKHGNQTAINTAGSAWIKNIRRYVNERQAEKISSNSKWRELFSFLQSHLMIDSNLFKPNPSYEIQNLDHLFQSTSTSDKILLGEFLRFRELLRYNLIYFKKDIKFRKKILPYIFDAANSFRRDISPQYMYILLTLYIAKKNAIFNNVRYKEFSNKLGLSKEKYQDGFHKGLNSGISLKNLTALCFTQYFWFDYRLSGSEHSEIHKILFNMFNELQLPS